MPIPSAETKQMTKLKCNSTFGNFRWAAECEVSDEQLAVLANAGLLQLLQRSPASRAEKVLAGYEKRPDKFERSSIEFSDANAKTLAQELSKPLEIAEGEEIKPAVVAEYHEIGASSAPKYVEEKGIIARHVKAGDFAQWMHDKVGFDATAGEADSTEVLKAVKAYKQRLLAEG